MAKRKVKFKIFKITNLITSNNNDKTILNYYNHRITDFIFINSLTFEKKIRKKRYNNDTETIYLANYNPFYSEKFSKGQIVTIRHGKEQRNVNVEDLSLVGLIKTNQGVEYVVDFYIQKDTGYMFVEQDENYVLNISKLRGLMKQHYKYNKQYILYLNTLDYNYMHEYRPVLNLEIIKPVNIKEQIKNLVSVNSVSIFEKDGLQDRDIEDISLSEKNSENNFIKQVSDAINQHDIPEYDTMLKLTKFKNNRFSGHLEKFINHVINSDKFGGYSVEGIDSYGVKRAFTPDSLTRDIQFETNANEDGLVDDKEKVSFINKYLEDNFDNMPDTFTKDEPYYKGLKGFLIEYTKFKGDYEDDETGSEEK
ncbi:hypothetical protein [Staphylococcus delphini]|uniref:hypothetical protein n=1 Tax=Staphylococcus delphini TaxID=53344 RepID=UPI0012D2F42E|nr:hypothetical protein [Staphylococcus delphini]MTV22849.1 hypothetical protein [Staphylococcus delphini]